MGLVSFSLLGINEWILLSVSVAALLPAIPLIIFYMKTHIHEYLLFCAVFVLSSIFSITFVIATTTDDLIFWQLAFTTRNLTYFLFFIHTSRMLWKIPPASVLYPGIILYSIVQFLILFWESNPNGYGAGIYLQSGIEIFSTDFRLIGNVFQLYVAILFLYGYYQVRLFNPSNRVKVAKYIMSILAFLLVLTRIFRLLQNFGLQKSPQTEILGSTLLTLGFISIGAVFIISPSSIMLSRVTLGGILVISEDGLPVSSMKIKEANIEVSPTLLSGIITAIDSVVGTIEHDKDQSGMLDSNNNLREVETIDRSILFHKEGKYKFSILTNSKATSLLRSSLKFFSRLYIKNHQSQLFNFKERGKQIENIDQEINLAFPYSAGLTLVKWE